MAAALPLTGYAAEDCGPATCAITLSVALDDQIVLLTYPDFPSPDENGLFFIDGQPFIVIPLASQEELDQASIDCVGEQLAAFFAQKGFDPVAAGLVASMNRPGGNITGMFLDLPEISGKLLELLQEHAAIGQPCQRVVIGQLADLFFSHLPVGYVFSGGNDPQIVRFAVSNRYGGKLCRKLFTVLADIDALAAPDTDFLELLSRQGLTAAAG